MKNDAAGCNNVLKYIYKTYYPVIQKFIMSNNGNDTEARDVFQDTITAFYEQAKQEDFRLTCSLKTYIYSISRNLWLKRLAKLNRIDRSITDFEDHVDIQNGNNQGNHDSEREIILGELIDKLDEGCKQILLYYYFDKLKMNQIKVKMDLGSEQSAKNKKHKCMKQLMEIVKNSNRMNVIMNEEFK